MNTFKREYLLFKRGRLLFSLIPIISLLLSIWINWGLKVFRFNYIDMTQIYSLIPLLVGFITPLLTYGIWNREVKLGLDKIILLNESSFRAHIYKKVIFYLLFYITLLFFVYLQLYVLNSVTDIDSGTVFTLNLGILLYVFLAISITTLLSLWVKNRVLYTVIAMTLIQLIQLFPIMGDFYLGIINLRTLIAIISISTLLLECFVFLVNRTVNKTLLSVISLLFLLSLFLDIRIDMTDTGRYTLDTYSVDYIEESSASIELNLYLNNKSNATITDHTQRLIKQLHQLDSVSGTITYSSSDGYFEAVRKYSPIKVEDGSYNFLVISTNGRVMVIPQLVHFDTLEFEIIKVIQYLREGELKDVALYLGNSDFREENFTSFINLMSEHVQSSILFPGDPISPELDLLIVIDHYDINKFYTDRVMDYINQGGNVLFAVNGLDTGNNLHYRETPLLKRLKELDIHVQPYLIADKRSIGIVEDDGTVKEYPLNLQTFPNRELLENPIISPFTGLTALHSSPVVSMENRYNYLLLSSKEAWLVDSSSGLDGEPENQFPIALYGELDSGSRMITIGNSLGLTEYNDNQDFFLRCIYYLIGKEELLTLRHKYNWDQSMYKIETSLYRGTLINLIKSYLLISPLWMLLLLAVFDKILVFFWIRPKSN